MTHLKLQKLQKGDITHGPDIRVQPMGFATWMEHVDTHGLNKKVSNPWVLAPREGVIVIVDKYPI